MPDYAAPLADMRLALDAVADLPALLATGRYGEVDADLIDAVLEEAARFAAERIAPLNQTGDRQGARLENGRVFMPEGFPEAYRAFVEGGWNGVPFEPEYGGQGLPWVVGIAIQEMWTAANMAFSLCPLLSQGAVEAISVHGTDEQKQLYLPRLISGEWTGTMNLTEPHAGSDVGALRTRAERAEDGTYRIRGTKIFITYGEHDMVENIVHLVLARLPDAPSGTRGISLFIVPKFLVNPDGGLGPRNDVRCVGVEHKLGIHGSPTCVLAYGEDEGAIGYLLGQENRGMAAMFTMMNNARLAVGNQGVGIADRAYQQALAFAHDRRQGRALGVRESGDGMVPIIQHPDVRRMLMTMRALSEAARAICYANAAAMDWARAAPDEEARAQAQARVDLLTPVSKAWATDVGVEAASLGIQVHGGMGFIEETGAAQHLRDARILPIYEGTNGIQAIDLVARKLPMHNGAVMMAMIDEMKRDGRAMTDNANAALQALGRALEPAIEGLVKTSLWLGGKLAGAPNDALAGATPYLRQFGLVAGGWLLGKEALALAEKGETGRAATAKFETVRFYATNILPQAEGLIPAITSGVEALGAESAEALAL